MQTGANQRQTAIILAGGLGTRLRSVVSDAPKPMALIVDRPFLEHQLEFWMRQGISRFVLSVGYMSDTIIGHFGNMWNGAEIDYAIEDEPLGTGGGLLLACNHVSPQSPVLLLNGDTFFSINLDDLKMFHVTKNADMTIALFEATEPDRYGRADTDPGDKLKRFGPEFAQNGDFANGGIYYFDTTVLKPWLARSRRKISFEREILPELITLHKRIFGFKSNGAFIDIGVPSDWARAHNVIQPTSNG